MSLQEIIQEIQALSVDEQKQLIKVLADIVSEPSSEPLTKIRSLRELRGLGKEVWAGIDAQAYIHRERDDWDSLH